ncbi:MULTISPECIES: DNA-processing protein DprA [unclassified Clostridium]|uniref:DNA-processing protein DprA n=1 Tax=unclassified Clostridium TaxID=2614128 RepID=UPI003217F018
MVDLFKLWIITTEVSNNMKKYIYDEYHDFDTLRKMVINDNMTLLPKKIVEKFQKSYIKIEELAVEECKSIKDIHICTIYDIDYPISLLQYEDVPFGIFYKGNISMVNEKKNISIVGSRKCTRYGIDVTNSMVEQLSPYEINIVSGMAKGIDSVAHRAAIKNNINTIAVLGSGIDVIYPKENYRLYHEILENSGCIISEFPLGTPPLSRNFPMRNRIISGMCELLVVTEGGEKSGTLITVGAALEQGKNIIVVPGSIFSSESKGTNKLIKDGAYVYTDIEDVLNLLNISRVSIDNKNITTVKSKLEERIYQVIDDNPIHIDKIIKLVDVDINRLYKLLFELQVKEEILCLSGNFYVRINK